MTPKQKQESEEARNLRLRLREVREYLGLPQEFVAKQAGLHRSALADIERGERKVDSLELARLAHVYRYPVEYFYGSEPDVPSDDGTLIALNRTAGQLSEEAKQDVLRFAKFLRYYGDAERKETQ
jgi:transcriptional regulator with XRE-family HTH domain